MVPLDANNRILVAAGLRRLRSGLGQPGLRALMQVAGRETAHAGSSDMGFALGPRINAAGRLEDMALGIECLLTDDDAHALRLATQLDASTASGAICRTRCCNRPKRWLPTASP